MKARSFGWMVLVAVGVAISFANIAEAKSKFSVVARLTVGRGVNEVTVDRDTSALRISVTDGAVIINTVVVREGSNATPYRVGRRFEKGEVHVINLPGTIRVNSVRISDDGRGSYELHVRR